MSKKPWHYEHVKRFWWRGGPDGKLEFRNPGRKLGKLIKWMVFLFGHKTDI